MRVADALLNKAEEVAFRELEAIVDDNSLRLFAKPRLSDVIVRDGPPLPRKVFDFYTRSHVDFVVTNADSKPLIVVEYDGRYHADAVQQTRDKMKDALCLDAGLGILRINANHVTKLYHGISVLRWIIEVTELEKSFYSAQQAGSVPWDEPFDAAMIMTTGSGRKWPYWLSVSATRSINAFIASKEDGESKGWAGVVGLDVAQNLHELSFIWFDNRIIWAKTAVKKQNFDFPAFDLLREITTCELDVKLCKFRRGETRAVTAQEFQPEFEGFCRKYDAHPSHSHWRGLVPCNYSWDQKLGWKFGK